MKAGKLKQAGGVVLIIIFGTLSLLMLFTIAYDIIQNGNDPDIALTAFSLIFTLILFYFPLKYGINLWRSGIAELRDVPAPSTSTITTSRIRIRVEDYRSLILRLTLRNPIFAYCGFMGISLLLTELFNAAGNTLPGIVMGLAFVFIPVLPVFTAKRNYNSSKNLKEVIAYEFNADNITVTGETFKSTQRWASLYKVKELDDWLLLYTNKIVAICIPKSAFNSKDALNAVLSFALNANGVKKELKRMK